MSRSAFGLGFLVAFGLLLGGCKDDKTDNRSAPPPPPTASSRPGACAAGGATIADPIAAELVPRTAGTYCVDPQGDIKTYGEKGKFTMDEVCTTAFDGECEVYKRFGLKRVVALRYVDGGGGAGTVEINLSTFGDANGAYGMFTKRVVADGDPAEPQAPRPLAAGGAGALGSGRGYVWRGAHLVELTYINEQESPEQLIKSSEGILTLIAKALGDKLPGGKELPPAAAALPTEMRLPNGIQYIPIDPLGLKGAGPAAIGFYKEGTRRWRVVSFLRDDAEQAKDTMKVIKGRPGAIPVSGIGDEGVQIVVQESAERPKSEYVFARKKNAVIGVGDEGLVLSSAEPLDKQADKRLSKEDKVARLKALAPAAPAAPK